MEAAAQNVHHEMRGINQAAGTRKQADVHLVSNKRTDSVCYKCGQQHHGPSHCPFCAAKCHKCGKVGHIKCLSVKKPLLQRLILKIVTNPLHTFQDKEL